MKKLLFPLLILCLTSLAFADEALVQFEQANVLYRTGEYQKAAAAYEHILSNGYEHAALYYNLGNCYFKLKKIPLAIVNYERAKRLAPSDEDIAYNLRLANLRIVDKIEPIPKLFFVEWWQAFVNTMSADHWGTASVILLWTTVVVLMLFFLIRSVALRRMLFLASFLALLFCALSFASMIQRLSFETETTEAIIMAQSISVKSAPDPQSTELFVLHEGVKVELLDTVGEWKKIRLADGKVGWIPLSGIEIV